MDSLEIIENISESIIDFDLNLTDIDNSNDNYWLNQNPIYMLVIYICIGIIGVVGNIITCIVIATNKSMHTVTNCYLFNLAISDLLMIIFSFPAFDGYDRYSSKTVCFLRGFIAEASVYISVLTIVAFSIERYLAICHPFFVRALSHLSRASRTIPTIWILGCAGALPVAMQIGIIHDYRSKDRAICTVVTASGPFYLELSTIVFFILPMILMIWLYTLMGIRLRSSRRRLETRDGGSRRTEEDARNNSNKRVLRMLVSVVAAFFFCWAPFHLQRLIAMHSEIIIYYSENIIKIYNVITRISAVFSYSSTMINPLLYNVMSNKFRQAFKDTFIKVWSVLSCSSQTTNSIEVIDLKKYPSTSD